MRDYLLDPLGWPEDSTMKALEVIASVNEVKCCACEKIVKIECRTTEDPRDPELLKPHVDNPDAWTALMCTEQGHQIAAACSDECMLKLFVEAVEQGGTSEISEDPEKVDTQPAPPAE